MTENNFPQGNLNPQQPSPAPQPLNTEPLAYPNVSGQEQYPAGQAGNYTYPQAGAPATGYTNTAYTPAPAAPAAANPQFPVPYQTNPYAAPYGVPYGYPVAYPQKEPKNGWAIAGFICSFLSPLLGFIFSGIGLNKAGKLGGKGKNLAIAGIVIAAVNMVLGIILSATGALDSLYAIIELG